MKKLLRITLLFLRVLIYSGDAPSYIFPDPETITHEEPDTIKSLADRAKINISHLPALYEKFYPQADINDLEFFFTIPVAQNFKKVIEPLPIDDKNLLMQEVSKIYTGRERWPIKRNFLALIVHSGADLNTVIVPSFGHPSTFLQETKKFNDKQGEAFALAIKEMHGPKNGEK